MTIDFPNLRVAVADDSHYMRQILRTILHGFGVRHIYDAADGAEAIEAVEHHRPDVLILDWLMPIMDGIEVTRMLRSSKNEPVRYVPIVMLSAYSTKARVIAARDAGVTEYLIKPCSAKDLHDRVAGCVLFPRAFVKTRSFFGPDRRRLIKSTWAGEDRRAAPAA